MAKGTADYIELNKTIMEKKKEILAVIENNKNMKVIKTANMTR